MLTFEWDSRKAEQNLRKHGVSFEEASAVFSQIQTIVFYDPDHSQNEDRYIIIGISLQGRLLLTAFTERGGKVRIISSRRATRSEENFYNEQTG